MKHINIKNKLEEMGVAPDSIVMGDFDYIGEHTTPVYTSKELHAYAERLAGELLV